MAEGNFGTGSGMITKLRDYMNKNKFLTMSVCVLMILIIIMVIVYTSLGEEDATTSVELTNPNGIDVSNSKNVEVLPQVQREEEKVEKEENKSSSEQNKNDPFAGPITLRGTIIGDNGNNQALIDMGGMAFVAKVNDKVGITWTVKKIDRKEVVLTSGSRELVLKLTDHEMAVSGTNSNSK